MSESDKAERVQKLLAQTGVGSRREMERAIEQGRVKVNGQPATLGDKVTLKDRIELDGKRVHLPKTDNRRIRVLLYNKPEGEICTRSDPEGRKTVFERLPKLKGERWIAVGRLDFNTSGLLLFTTDGSLANALMHPSSQIDREYLVRIQGEVDEAMKQRLREGVMLEDGVAQFTDIVDSDSESREVRKSGGSNHWFYCVVMEGKNREVRRLWESQGVKVSRLKRVRFGNIFIPSHVRVGQWLELDNREIKELCLTAGVDAPEHQRPLSQVEKEKKRRQQNKLRKGRAARPR